MSAMPSPLTSPAPLTSRPERPCTPISTNPLGAALAACAARPDARASTCVACNAPDVITPSTLAASATLEDGRLAAGRDALDTAYASVFSTTKPHALRTLLG